MASIFERFELSSIERMLNNAKEVHRYSGKPVFMILIDMARCILKDHVGYMEYNLFHFVGKPQNLRDTYVTFDYSQHLFKTLNDPDHLILFNDKLSFKRTGFVFTPTEKLSLFFDVSNVSLFEDGILGVFIFTSGANYQLQNGLIFGADFYVKWEDASVPFDSFNQISFRTSVGVRL